MFASKTLHWTIYLKSTVSSQ